MPRHADHLNLIKISSPCSADWDSMTGNEQVRFCSHCNLHVHNLSAMTRSEAMELVAKSKGRLCARFYRRPNGTVQTAPHPTQSHHIARRAARIAAGAFGAVLSLAANGAAQTSSTAGDLLQGKVHPTARADESRPATTDAANASIVGRVSDPQPAPIAGASVKLFNQRTGLEMATTSDKEGVFRFQSLAAGVYTLKVEMAGFSSYQVNDFYLQENTERRVEATLDVGVMGAIAIAVPAEPLIKAAWENNLTAVKELLGIRVDNVNTVTEYYSTALAQAVANGNLEMVSALLLAGADVNTRGDNGRTALMYLGANSKSDVVRALVAAGAMIDLEDEEGNTALLFAAAKENADVLQALLDAGAAVNAKNKEGRTALMQAADMGILDNVKTLIKAGAEINARDKEDSTALSLAHDPEVEALLEAYGAVE
ncbi:MAG TPA: ankyrin repeat domain-containing protein [Pyrinomonadaceae bacterium]